MTEDEITAAEYLDKLEKHFREIYRVTGDAEILFLELDDAMQEAIDNMPFIERTRIRFSAWLFYTVDKIGRRFRDAIRT